MTRRIFLHVGAPKTGTTFLQNVLWAGREEWPTHGVTYPLAHSEEHFDAAIGVQDLKWAGQDHPEFAETWPNLVDRAKAAEGDIVISNELLAAATPEVVARIAADFADFERHLIFTVRPMSRMLISDWQEQIKNRHQAEWPAYLHEALDEPESHFGTWVPNHHNVLEILQRWAPFASGQQAHVIVNKQGADASVLWRDFAGIVGLPGDVPLPERAVNAAIGLDATNALAVINHHLRWVNEAEYRKWVRHYLLEEIFPTTYDTTKVTLPYDFAVRIHADEVRVVGELADLDLHVVGDLAELVGPEPVEDGVAQVAPAIGIADGLGKMLSEVVERDRRLVGAEAAVAEWQRIEEIRKNRWWRKALERSRTIPVVGSIPRAVTDRLRKG